MATRRAIFTLLIYGTSFAFILSTATASAAAEMMDPGNSVQKSLEMIVTDHPLATAAGCKILQMGGTAADAFVAVQSMLGLVEPQSSGLGGGGFVVYHDAASNTTTTFDGREKAPSAATEDRFEGMPMFPTAWQSGLSVGVPGMPRLMEMLHGKYGRLPWDEALFEDAHNLATEGYEIHSSTADVANFLLSLNGFDCVNRLFFRDEAAFDYFVDGDTCKAKPAGSIQTNLDYADVLYRLVAEGSDGFYKGSNAEAIVNAVRNDVSLPGDMTLQDLAGYEVIQRDPVCHTYRDGDKIVCGMGPPSSGGLAVGQILKILDTYEGFNASHPMDADSVHLFSQAGRLAFADRDKYVADSDFVDVPVAGMLDEEYLSSRANLISTDIDMGIAEPGTPPGAATMEGRGLDTKHKFTGTSHISIIDRCGNALSATTTIEAPFGNSVMVNGYLLNNELTDFSFDSADENGLPIANRVEGNKRPRSSMSPTIIFDAKKMLPELLTGSPGGSNIIGYTAKTIWLMYQFSLDPQAAVNVPHYMNNNEDETLLEPHREEVTDAYDMEGLIAELEGKNHIVDTGGLVASGIGSIYIQRDGDGNTLLLGGADPRRDVSIGGDDRHDDDDSSYCERSDESGSDNSADDSGGDDGNADDSGSNKSAARPAMRQIMGGMMGVFVMFIHISF